MGPLGPCRDREEEGSFQKDPQRESPWGDRKRDKEEYLSYGSLRDPGRYSSYLSFLSSQPTKIHCWLGIKERRILWILFLLGVLEDPFGYGLLRETYSLQGLPDAWRPSLLAAPVLLPSPFHKGAWAPTGKGPTSFSFTVYLSLLYWGPWRTRKGQGKGMTDCHDLLCGL